VLEGLTVCFGGGSSSQFSSLTLVGSPYDTRRRSGLSSARVKLPRGEDRRLAGEGGGSAAVKVLGRK